MLLVLYCAEFLLTEILKIQWRSFLTTVYGKIVGKCDFKMVEKVGATCTLVHMWFS